MLILPIANKNHIMNVRIKLLHSKKLQERTKWADAKKSDIIVNKESFNKSIFSESLDKSVPVDFVRSKSILYPRSYLVTTNTTSDSDKYDIYEVEKVPAKVDEGMDNLYSAALTDIRKQVPDLKEKGRYISFEKLGVGANFTEEKIALLQRIIKEYDKSSWPRLFEQYDIADLEKTIDFINNFECEILSETTIPEKSLEDTLKGLEVINSKDARNLRNYYNMAYSNRDIYLMLSYVNKILTDKPLNLIKSEKVKKLIKVKKDIQ